MTAFRGIAACCRRIGIGRLDLPPQADVQGFHWPGLISQLTKAGQAALRGYNEMRENGLRPSTHTFVSLLKACSNVGDVKRIHANVIESRKESDLLVANTLVHMYAKCGSIADAWQVFDRMLHRDVVSWTTIISGYAQSEEAELALKLYESMQLHHLQPNERTFVAVLKACSSLAEKEEGEEIEQKVVKIGILEKGKAIHSEIARSGLESDVFVASTLVHMYATCGSSADARHVFDRMLHPNVVSWNAMILGYAQQEGELALQLYERMQREGFEPNARTFVAALKACTTLAEQEQGKGKGKGMKRGPLERGKAIHAQVAQSGLESNIFVANTLVDMYAKCGSIEHARQLFDRMLNRNVVSWNAIIMGYAKEEKGKLALQQFERMQREGFEPNARTFVAVLKACSTLAEQEQGKEVDGKLVRIGLVEKGRAMHSELAKRGHDSDVYVANALVDMYAKCGSMVDACQVFDRMLHRNVVSWTAMILGYAQREEGELALQLYDGMRRENLQPNARTFVAVLKACSKLAEQEQDSEMDGNFVKSGALEKGRAIHSQVVKSHLESDVFVANTLVDMYAKCGSIADARQVFDRMLRRDVVSWTAMILAYAQRKEGELALQLFERMQQEGIQPNAWTFVAALTACGSLACLDVGKAIHGKICRAGLEGNATIASSLIDMYGRCGSLVDAQQLFDAWPRGDLLTWNALIAGYVCHGDSKHVFNLFQRMVQAGIQPDGTTFLCVLTICSHAGLVNEGQEYFQAMKSGYGIIPTLEHYTCMVDLFGRAGRLDEAVAVVRTMPFKPDKVTWITILSSCRKWADVEIGRYAFDHAMIPDKNHAALHELMSNFDVAAGFLEESNKVEEARRKVKGCKAPGSSWWIDGTGIVHDFFGGGQGTPQAEKIK